MALGMKCIKMKKIIVLVLAILLIGTVLAGAIGITTEKNIDKERLDKLKETAGTGTIAPAISNVRCDINYCTASVNQDKLINSQITVPARYCSEYSESENPEEVVCLKYISYSDQEIRGMIDDKIEEKLINYADAQIERENQMQNKDIGGELVFSEK